MIFCHWFLDRKSGDHQMLIYFKCNIYFWCLELRQPILCGTWLNILFTFLFRQEWKCSYPVKFQCLSCSQRRCWTIMSFMADYQNAASGRCKISYFFLFFSTIYIFTTQLLSFRYTKVRFKYYHSFMLHLHIFVLLNINITTCFLGLVLLCLTPLSNTV